MNITKENIDALNAIVTVNIVADDYKEKVAKILNDYRKTANIPGFRKGHVPIGMVRKQYGKGVMIDEVNKLLQESLNKFLVEEKLDILGNPLPKINENFSWDAEKFSFEFELGLTPEFDVDLKSDTIKSYNIVATEELIEKELENIQTRYGKLISQEEAEEHSNITGTFVNEEKEINKKSTFSISDLKGKENKKKLIGTKVGDVVELKTKELFEENSTLQSVLGVSNDDAKDLDIKTIFTVEEINFTEKAEFDQELFDKLFTDGSVTNVTQLKEKIKEDAEKQFQQQADQQLLNAVTESLVENTKFDLPSEFLQKWLQTTSEKQLTAQEAVNEYQKSEKGLRYQLIEGKIMKDNDINIDHTELVNYAKEFIKMQMAQFGNTNPEDKELEDIASRILSNEEERERLQGQLVSQKLLTFFKENMTFDTREVSFEEFIKEVYNAN